MPVPFSPSIEQRIRTAVANNTIISANTTVAPAGKSPYFQHGGKQMAYNHSFAIKGIDTKGNADPADDEVILGNPWGIEYTVQMTFADFNKYFRDILVTED